MSNHIVRGHKATFFTLTKMLLCGRVEYILRLPGFILLLLLWGGGVGCGGQMQPIPDLWMVPIETIAPSPTPPPTSTPVMSPPIWITPTSPTVLDDEAVFTLNVLVEDEKGMLTDALVSVIWSDGHAPLVIGPTDDIQIPIPSAWSPFVVVVEKQGYAPVRQPFIVSLSATMTYEWVVVLQYLGDVA